MTEHCYLSEYVALTGVACATPGSCSAHPVRLGSFPAFCHPAPQPLPSPTQSPILANTSIIGAASNSPSCPTACSYPPPPAPPHPSLPFPHTPTTRPPPKPPHQQLLRAPIRPRLKHQRPQPSPRPPAPLPQPTPPFPCPSHSCGKPRRCARWYHPCTPLQVRNTGAEGQLPS